VSPEDTSYLYPASGHEAMLYTCSDFGTSENRLLALLDMVGDGEHQAAEEIDRSHLHPTYKLVVDNAFDRFYETYEPEALQKKLEKLRGILETINPDNLSPAGADVLEYIQYNIAFSPIWIDISNLGFFGE
jgi:hypothetical protein